MASNKQAKTALLSPVLQSKSIRKGNTPSYNRIPADKPWRLFNLVLRKTDVRARCSEFTERAHCYRCCKKNESLLSVECSKICQREIATLDIDEVIKTVTDWASTITDGRLSDIYLF